MRLVRYGGAIPLVALNASRRVLNSARAATGSQWRVRRSGVACENFGWLKTRRAAAFWTRSTADTMIVSTSAQHKGVRSPLRHVDRRSRDLRTTYTPVPEPQLSVN